MSGAPLSDASPNAATSNAMATASGVPLSNDDYEDVFGQVRRIAILDSGTIGDSALASRGNDLVTFADIAIILAFESERRERGRFGKSLDVLHAQLTSDDHNSLVWRYISVFADERGKRSRS